MCFQIFLQDFVPINHIAKTTLFVSQVTEIEVVFVVWDWKGLIVLWVSYHAFKEDNEIKRFNKIINDKR